MGSSIEASIVFSVVIVILCYLILAPENIIFSSISDVNHGMEELRYQIDDNGVMGDKVIDSCHSISTSPERLCTYFKGITDNYYFTYVVFKEALSDD